MYVYSMHTVSQQLWAWYNTTQMRGPKGLIFAPEYVLTAFSGLIVFFQTPAFRYGIRTMHIFNTYKLCTYLIHITDSIELSVERV